jgi:hypothetical protein
MLPAPNQPALSDAVCHLYAPSAHIARCHWSGAVNAGHYLVVGSIIHDLPPARHPSVESLVHDLFI